MMKKGIIVGTALVGIAGGFIIAQDTLFGSAEQQISADEAKGAALKAFDGTIVEFEFDQDDRTPHYEFDIKNAMEKAEVKVDATTGKVTITEREALKQTTGEKVNTQAATILEDDDDVVASKQQSNPDAQQPISKSQAINIAHTVAKGTVVKTELDEDDGRLVYEIELRDGNTGYELDINAYTGKVVDFEKDVDDDHDDVDDRYDD